MSPTPRDDRWTALTSNAYDLVVIGAGATGAGVALDAAARGLRVALIERDDVSAGTSSRSTKLIHGGVRYLEKAVKEFDRTQFNLVRDALHERATLIRIAPHLAKPIPLVTPLYNWLQVPYFMAGLKLYDGLAGRQNLAPSRFIDAQEAKRRFPMLQAEGLRGGVLYYDGQFDDARFNVAIALTAEEQGATVVNHVAATGFDKENGALNAVHVRDTLDGREGVVRTKAVVNATGPFSDAVRRMDDPNVDPMLSVSSGIHVMLDARFSPPETGLLIPETEDGRVLFLLPWLGHTLVGTTDNPAEIEPHPKAHEDDVAYVLRHVEKYFDIPVSRDDVKASWSGLRPLVADPDSDSTARLSRDHVIVTSPAGLVTITGGKWTTYRRMAVEAVDEALAVAGLDAPAVKTDELPLVGGAHFTPTGAGALQEAYGFDADVAAHLHTAYGDRADAVAQLARERGLEARLAPDHPILEAEVPWAAEHELAATSVDVLARRTRLAFLDTDAALAALPRVGELLQASLGWDDARRDEDRADAVAYIV